MISLKLDSQPFHPSHKSKHFQKKDQNVNFNKTNKTNNLNNSTNSFNFNLKRNSNEIKTQTERRDKKVVKITTVYCSNYLKMFKEYNTELPSDCSKEQLDYIAKTQELYVEDNEQTSSMQPKQFNPTNQMKQIHSNRSKSTQSFNQNKYNNYKKMNNYNNQNKQNNHHNQNNRQKKEYHSSSCVNHAQFTSKKKSNDIEILIPTSKPIPIHHPSLLSSNESHSINSSDSSSSSLSHSSSNEEFPDVIDKYKQLHHLNQSNEINDNEFINLNDEEDEEELNEEIQSIMDQRRRISREKQIFFGKNTNEYHNYLSVIPKNERRISDPHTPDIESSLSKRKWDRVVRRWRRSLHAFDNVNQQNQVELARALAFRLQNEHNPKKTMLIYSSLPYSSYLVDE